jgi:hypothetical protein
LYVRKVLSAHLKHITNTLYSVYFNVARKEKKPEDLGDVFKQDMSFLKHLIKRAKVLTEHYFYFYYWSPQELQVVIEPLLSRKWADMDVAGLLLLITFAGIDFDEEELFQSNIIKRTFEDETSSECLLNLLALLFGMTADNVRNSLFTQLKCEILICFVSMQSSGFLEKVQECCTNRKSLLDVIL